MASECREIMKPGENDAAALSKITLSRLARHLKRNNSTEAGGRPGVATKHIGQNKRLAGVVSGVRAAASAGIIFMPYHRKEVATHQQSSGSASSAAISASPKYHDDGDIALSNNVGIKRVCRPAEIAERQPPKRQLHHRKASCEKHGWRGAGISALKPEAKSSGAIVNKCPCRACQRRENENEMRAPRAKAEKAHRR